MDICERLRKDGLIREAKLTAFGGGVSSDVWRVDEPGREPFVVKQCLAQLRVKADWFADPARLESERRYLSEVGRITPGSVPRLLRDEPGTSYLAMEYLGEGFTNWKGRLLAGDARLEDARRAAGLLGQIHQATRGDQRIAAAFETGALFHQLRLEPYLLATGATHPELATCFYEMVDELAGRRECLVHGDFSPKNMLVNEERFVVLDAETAWFGDPAFDLAFLLNHLHLKALYHAPIERGFADLIREARGAYFAAAGEDARLDERTARLLLMLLLARVDGKSPVEYLNPEAGEHIRTFVFARLPQWQGNLGQLTAEWFDSLRLSKL